MEKINTDSAPEHDILGRKEFAKQIANSLKLSFNNGEESFVFGLNGKWGSGKTTLMSYLKEEIVNHIPEKQLIVFEFNPWMFSGKDKIIVSFLDQLVRQISKYPTLKKKLSKLTGLVKYLEPVKYLHSGLGDLQKSIIDISDKFSKEPTITELKNQIDKALIKDSIRLIVLIDDLDRLTPDEVTETFQIIKLNASFKNSIFIVSYDKGVIQDMLSERYNVDGGKFLEKIIQVDYRIPDILEETISSVFFSTLKRFMMDLKIEYNEEEFSGVWFVYRLRFYFTTIRDIHRYFNALKLRLPAIKKEVDVLQFCLIEAIRVFDYDLYEYIQKNYLRSIQFNPKSDFDASLEFTNENTEELYNYLFNDRTQEFHNPISDPKFFDRYFSLSLKKEDAKNANIRLFLKNPRSREHVLDTAMADGSIQSFLLELRNQKPGTDCISNLIRWKAHTEYQFQSSITEFMTSLESVIAGTGDFADGFKTLMYFLPADDGHFNPAKFYLIFYFNNVLDSNEATFFSKHRDVIKNYQQQMKSIESDILKRYENDNIVFQRPNFKTDFFHKLFLALYFKKYPEDYAVKFKSYTSAGENLFAVIRHFLSLDSAGKFQVNRAWVESLLNPELLQHIETKIGDLKRKGLSLKEGKIFDAFQENLVQIRDILKESVTMRDTEPS